MSLNQRRSPSLRIVPSILLGLAVLAGLVACGDSGSAPEPPSAPAPATPEPTPTPVSEPEPASPEPAADAGGAGDPVARGKAHYQLYCASCHGATGAGDGPASAGLEPKPARHNDGAYMNALSDAHLHKVIAEGGPAVGKSPLMAPWSGTLSDEQIDDVIVYIRSLAVPPYPGP
jgi:mono/diheme cytochrome c family protein